MIFADGRLLCSTNFTVVEVQKSFLCLCPGLRDQYFSLDQSVQP